MSTRYATWELSLALISLLHELSLRLRLLPISWSVDAILVLLCLVLSTCNRGCDVNVSRNAETERRRTG